MESSLLTHEPVRGRLAPSPSGRMHAGNIFAALMAWLIAKSQEGKVILRIEDLDVERSRVEYVDQVMSDFEALGLTWDEGPYFQQTNQERYQEVLSQLEDAGLVYPCFCTRADLHAASAPHRGEKSVYPGTCRNLTAGEQQDKAKDRAAALRLIVPDETWAIEDVIQGRYQQNLATECGDYLIRRSDGLFAYQLACVVDDCDQGINSIVRGVDLLCSTPQQEHLRHYLGFNPAQYAHVPLLVAEEGRRLSKRDKDAALDVMLETYGSPEAVMGHIAYKTGLIPEDMPVTPEDIVKGFDQRDLPSVFPDTTEILYE